MAIISKICGLALDSMNKVSSLAKTSIAKIDSVVNQLFSNTKSLSHGTANSTDGVYASTTSTDFQVIKTDPWSIS